MKVTGISFGSKNGRTDILVKEALFAAKAAGAEVEFINTHALNIGHCRSCGYCNRCRDEKTEIHCCLKDDFHILEDAFMEADGLIIGAPVYVVGPNGQVKNFIDRLSPHRDRSEMIEENKRRAAQGREPLEPNLFKDRYIGYISVGGAQTHNWVAFGLPTLHLLSVSQCLKAVGHIDAYDQGRTGSPLLDKGLMKMCGDLGRTVTQSIGKPYSEVNDWVGPKGLCPVCHNTLLDFMDGVRVECPTCGIRGTVSIVDGELKVSWPESEPLRARNTEVGVYEHYYEIRNMIKVCVPKLEAARDELEEEMKKYLNFEEAIKSV